MFKRQNKSILDYFTPLKKTESSTPVLPIRLAPKQDNKPTVTFDEPNAKQQYYVFTDGSQIREAGTHRSLAVAWAYVIKRKDGTRVHKDAGKLRSSETNQRAELLSIYNALQWCKTNMNVPCDLHVYTDSEYSLNCLTLWVYGWKKAGWKNAKKQNVKHRDIIEPCFLLMEALRNANTRVQLTHIRSHTNNDDFFAKGNAEADEMASNMSRLQLR